MIEFVKGKIINYEEQNPNSCALIYAVIGSFGFAFQSMFTKMLVNVSAYQILFARSMQMLMFNTYITNNQKVEMYKHSYNQLLILLLRCLMASTSIIMLFIGVKMIPISVTIVLRRTNTIWTSIITIFILRTQKLNLEIPISVFICLLGLILIVKPFFYYSFFSYFSDNIVPKQEKDISLLGVMIILTSALAQTISHQLVNLMGKQKVNQFKILQFNAIFSSVTPSLLAVVFQEDYIMPSSYQCSILVVIGCIGYVSMLSGNRSMMKGKVLEAQLVGTLSVVWGVVLDVIVIGYMPDIPSLIGCLLITGITFYLVIKKKYIK